MASSKEYAYYIKGNKLSLVQKDLVFSSGQTLSQPGLNDLGIAGRLLWKSPKESVADGLEIQYVHSPDYFINETEDVNTEIDTYVSLGGLLKIIDQGDNDYSASPESLSDGSYIVLRKAGKFNGLHKVKEAGAGYITLYTKYSGSATVQKSFEETIDVYYNVDVLNDEDDTIDLPDYLCTALVYYVKAKYAEDAGEIELKEYFMKEFRAITEKFHAGKQRGPFRVQSFSMIR
tara:strand:+ start:274 stop:969 length:696 start_codon:yes stop_codon:yes gene_type:complete